MTESFRLSIYTWIASSIVVLVVLPLCIIPLYRKWQRNLLLHENHLAENQLVPSVYIRDHVGNIKDIPFQNTHTISNFATSHFGLEARQRRLLDTNNETDNHMLGTTDPAYGAGNQYGFGNQTRYPFHNHQL
jgi:hypothetical protein